jgi:cytochrome c553
MTYIKSLLFANFICLAVTFFSIGLVHAAGPTKTEIMAHSCLTCHGPNGAGSGKIPELKGLEKSDITESLFGFASGDEKSTIMSHHAKAFTDKEINMLAEYFAALSK